MIHYDTFLVPARHDVFIPGYACYARSMVFYLRDTLHFAHVPQINAMVRLGHAQYVFVGHPFNRGDKMVRRIVIFVPHYVLGGFRVLVPYVNVVAHGYGYFAIVRRPVEQIQIYFLSIIIIIIIIIYQAILPKYTAKTSRSDQYIYFS